MTQRVPETSLYSYKIFKDVQVPPSLLLILTFGHLVDTPTIVHQNLLDEFGARSNCYFTCYTDIVPLGCHSQSRPRVGRPRLSLEEWLEMMTFLLSTSWSGRRLGQFSVGGGFGRDKTVIFSGLDTCLESRLLSCPLRTLCPKWIYLREFKCFNCSEFKSVILFIPEFLFQIKVIFPFISLHLEPWP